MLNGMEISFSCCFKSHFSIGVYVTNIGMITTTSMNLLWLGNARHLRTYEKHEKGPQ